MLFDFVFEGFGRGFWKWGENWHVGKFSSWVELIESFGGLTKFP